MYNVNVYDLAFFVDYKYKLLWVEIFMIII